jgi:hypothetical protein
VNEALSIVTRPSSTEDFAAFYRREYDRAVRLAWLLTGSRAAAEDVVQTAMTEVYRALDRIESPEAYLRRSVVNRGRSWRRDERRQRDRVAMLASSGGDPGPVLNAIGCVGYSVTPRASSRWSRSRGAAPARSAAGSAPPSAAASVAGRLVPVGSSRQPEPPSLWRSRWLGSSPAARTTASAARPAAPR